MLSVHELKEKSLNHLLAACSELEVEAQDALDWGLKVVNEYPEFHGNWLIHIAWYGLFNNPEIAEDLTQEDYKDIEDNFPINWDEALENLQEQRKAAQALLSHLTPIHWKVMAQTAKYRGKVRP